MLDSTAPGSKFVPFLARINPGTDYTAAGISRAVAANALTIFLGDLPRQQFLEALFRSKEIRRLPIGHLLDRRVVVPPSLCLDTRQDVADLLRRLLDSTDQGDASAVVAEVLGLDPVADAQALWRLKGSHPDFFENAARGDLDLAIARIRGLPSRGIARSDAEDLIARLLLYFSAFEVQMIAGGIWAWRHPPTRLQQGQSKYFVTSGAQDVRAMAGATEKTFAAFVKGREKSPRDAIIKMLRQNAGEIAEQGNHNAMLPQLEALVAATMPETTKARAAAKDRIKKGGTSQEVYTDVHGVTPAQALAFAACRLIQLKSLAPRLVATLGAGKPVGAVSLRECWPSRASPEVAVLLHVYRTRILESYHSKIAGRCGDGKRSIREELDCWDKAGTVPATEVLNELSGMRGKGLLVRPSLGGPVREAQRFDILPDWRLRRTLVDIAREADQARRRHRPRNVWKASGRR